MSEIECLGKRARINAHAMMTSHNFGVDGGFNLISAMMPPLDAEAYKPGCDRVCDGPVTIERGNFDVLRLIGITTREICSAECRDTPSPEAQ